MVVVASLDGAGAGSNPNEKVTILSVFSFVFNCNRAVDKLAVVLELSF